MVHMKDMQQHHEESSDVCKNENEEVDIIKLIRWKMINPLQTHNSSELLDISTGEKASTIGFITAEEKGMQILKDVQQSDAPKVKSF